MLETLDKMWMAGLGALSMTKDRAEKMFNAAVRRGEAEQSARTGFIKDIMDEAEKTRKEIEKIVSEQVSNVLEKCNVATRDDIERLEKKINKLLKQEQ